MEPVVMTFTGRRVNPIALRPEDIDIRDVAHHLATLNRFVGACKEPISIAQHSIYVARLVRQAWYDGEMNGPHDHLPLTVDLAERQALFHDGSEYVLNDVTRWVKKHPAMAHYREIEASVQATVYQWAGCSVEEPKALEVADMAACCWEGQQGIGPAWFDHEEKLPNRVQLTPAQLEVFRDWYPWSWRLAEYEFLKAFRRLTNASNHP